MKKIWMLPSVLIISFGLIGCRTSQDDKATNDLINEASVDEGTEDNGVVTLNDDGTQGNNGDQAKLKLSDESADKVTELEEVYSATVIITDNRAYVGAVLEGGGEELGEIEEKIAEQVKATNANIENVYVSLDPDFVDQMTDYGDKIQAGEPVEGLFEGFTEVVQRIFPNAN